jgi:hypothetical protein
MKKQRLMPLILLAATLLSACSFGGTPTMSAADSQNTAVALAQDISRMTQAAIPTATSVPPTPLPTFTPLPTNTPIPEAVLPSPTIVAQLPQPGSEIPVSTKSPQSCDQPMAENPEGPHVKVSLVNKYDVSVTVSLWLDVTKFGECGYRGYEINKNSTLVVEIPVGSYTIFGWTNSGEKIEYPSVFIITEKPGWAIIIKDETVRVVLQS